MTLLKSLSALTILAALFISTAARADLAPEDACMQPDVGMACDNAIGSGSQPVPGVCTETMCTRASPNGAVTYACYRCLPKQGGTGGEPSDAGGSSAGGSSAGGSSAAGKTGSGGGSAGKSSGGGCSVAQPIRGEGVLPAGLTLLGLALAGFRRRRRSLSS